MSGKPRKRRVLKAIVLAILVLIVATGIAGWYYYARDYAPDFALQRGVLVDVSVTTAGEDTASPKSWITLVSSSGMRVECGMVARRVSAGRLPAVILLGGKATGKYAIDYVPELGDIIVVAVDYPYEPRESYTLAEFIGDVPAIRSALMAMVPSVMLLTDYLVQRPDVDSTKIVVLGYSFGAPFVPCILANDKRPAMAAMVFGGGEMYSLIEHNVRRYEGAVASKFVGLLGGFLLRPLEPLRYADKVSPVPLIMINGTEDEMIPKENVQMVYEKAVEPKKLIWLQSGHVRPDKLELTNQIVATLTREFYLMDILDEYSY